jgi:hypothetical protein
MPTCCGWRVGDNTDQRPMEYGVPRAFENRLLSPLMCSKVQDAMDMEYYGLLVRR